MPLPPPAPRHAPAAKVWFALSTVYLVWGSTYLAIRVMVRTMPPMLSSGVRFALAGAALYVWAIRRGDVHGDRPGLAQWRAATIVGGLLIVGGNGLVVLAERTVPSGVAALLIAAVPLWMALIGFLWYRERLPPTALIGIILGFGGVALLAGGSGSGRVEVGGALLLVGAALSWSIGSLYARAAPLPSRPMVGTAMEMLTGGFLLTIVGLVRGELSGFSLGAVSAESLWSWVYLLTVGSLAGFTAYIWALGHAPTSLVSTYAYVNPIVAVFLGWLILDETLTARTFIAGAVIVAAVALIVTARTALGSPPPDIPAQAAESS
jgi:drug/metabolite transporter (DMT)-like permease